MDFGIELEPYAGRSRKALLYYRDGITSTVSVHDVEGARILKVNGKADASSQEDVATQLLLGHLGLLFGPPTKSVLVVGFASGATVGAVARHPEVEKIDVVEIEPAMIEASHYFDFMNGRPLEDPRVRMIFDDGRAYLSGTAEKYDLIISEPSNPWMTGVSNLFTREFFHAARAALAPEGRLLQWVQLYGIDERALASVLAAVRSEFSHVYGFSHVSGWPDLLLLAMQRPLTASDLPRWSELPASVRDDLIVVGNSSDADLRSMLRLPPKEIDRLYGPEVPVNTDDNLLVELSTPWLINSATLSQNWSRFQQANRGALPVLDGVEGPLDAEGVAELALSYASLRKDLTVAQRLIAVAESRGKSATTIAAALSVARQMDPDLATDDQIATLDSALLRSRDSFGSWLLRAQVHFEGGDPAAGLADVAEALRLRSGDPGARLLRARLLASAGRLDEAQQEYDALSRAGYDRMTGDFPRERARLLVARNRPSEAIPALEAILIEGDPGWPEGWQLLARAHALSGDQAAAERALQNHDVARRNQPRFFHRQARRALWQGDRTDAAYLLALTVGLAPDDHEAKLELATLREMAAREDGTAAVAAGGAAGRAPTSAADAARPRR
jgi:spermidine synthase/Tfp pilus assembly protein PilF